MGIGFLIGMLLGLVVGFGTNGHDRENFPETAILPLGFLVGTVGGIVGWFFS